MIGSHSKIVVLMPKKIIFISIFLVIFGVLTWAFSAEESLTTYLGFPIYPPEEIGKVMARQVMRFSLPLRFREYTLKEFASINTALNDNANIEAVATDSTGSSTAATKNYLTIRQKAVADKDSAASVVVLTDKSSTASATGFTSTPTSATGRNSAQSIDVSAVSANFDNILNQLDTSLKMVNGLRVHLGAFQKNNMESNLTSLSVAKENISASESAIRDTDMASEMVSFTKSQILMQASQAMLTQANQAPQGILSMLR